MKVRVQRCVTVMLSVIALASCSGRKLMDRGREPAAVDPKVQWLQEHAVRVRGWEEADLSDLEPLRHVIGDARIVQLGESDHGDGTAFLAKAKLIRFLHERMGFDVLAVESHLYECALAGEMLRGEGDATTSVKRCFAPPIWSQSEQMAPLVSYVGSRARSERPIELAGFDFQPSRRLIDQLRQAFTSYGRPIFI